MCDNSGGGNDAFKCGGKRLMQMCAITLGGEITYSNVCHDSVQHVSFKCVLQVWGNDSCKYVPWLLEKWLIPMCAMTLRDMNHSQMCHICLGHTSFKSMPWLWGTWFIHVSNSNMCHDSVRRDSFRCMPWLIHVHRLTHSDLLWCGTWLIQMCAMQWDMTHSNVCHDFAGNDTSKYAPCSMGHDHYLNAS